MEQFDGQTFPTSLITRWCRNEWMYEDVSVTLHMSYPYACSSEMIRSLLLIMPFAGLVWKRMVISNFDVWCSMMKNTSLRIWVTDTYCAIPLLLCIGTVQIYVYCRYKYSADIYIYCYTIITLVVVTLYYWWHLSQHKRWSKCIWAPDFINPIHQLRFVMSDCWTSMNNYLWETTTVTPVVSRAAHVAVEDVSLPSDQDMTSSESKLLSISIRGDGNIHFTGIGASNKCTNDTQSWILVFM